MWYNLFVKIRYISMKILHNTIFYSSKAVFFYSALFVFACLLWGSTAFADTGKEECSSDLLALDVVVQNLILPDEYCIKYLHSHESNFALAIEETTGGVYFYGSLTAADNKKGIFHPHHNDNIIEVYLDRLHYNKNEVQSKRWKRHILLHELCHASQYYYKEKIIKKRYHRWYTTPAGREFIDIVEGSVKDGKFFVSSYPYIGMYNKNPLELAAEVCAIFLSPYATTTRYADHEIRGILYNKQLQEWFQKYMGRIPVSTLSIIRAQEQESKSLPYVEYHNNGNVKVSVLYDAYGIKSSAYYYTAEGKHSLTRDYDFAGKVSLEMYYDTKGVVEYLSRRVVYRLDGTRSATTLYNSVTRNREYRIVYYEDGVSYKALEWFAGDGTLKKRDKFFKHSKKRLRSMTEHYHEGEVWYREYYNSNGIVVYRQMH